MTKVIYEFDRIEDKDDLIVFREAWHMKYALSEILNILRGEAKYEDKVKKRSSTEIREMIYDALNDADVNMSELELP